MSMLLTGPGLWTHGSQWVVLFGEVQEVHHWVDGELTAGPTSSLHSALCLRFQVGFLSFCCLCPCNYGLSFGTLSQNKLFYELPWSGHFVTATEK